MDEIYRETFRKCYVYLVENIQYKDLNDELLQQEVLPMSTLEDINTLSNRREQVRKLLDVLPRRSNETFNIFLGCLVNTDQKHIADELMCMLNSICTQNGTNLLENRSLQHEKLLQTSYEPLPQLNVKSLPEHNIESNENKIKKNSTSVLSFESTVQKQSIERDYYVMDSYPLGYILIINNEKFSADFLDARNGSTKDASDLRDLFWRLGFYCDIKHNIKAEEIKQSLLEFSKLDDHKKFCCCAVALMSHGDEGHIYGFEGKKVSVNELIVYFSDQNCPNLKDKPKLFIIQACRNNVSSKPPTREPDNVSQKSPLMRLMSLDLSSDSVKRNSRADMLIAYSTASGNKSYRNKKTGSIFIQNLIDVFNKKSDTTSVTDMLIEINRLLREQYPHQEQIGVPEVALTKKWFLKQKLRF